MRRPVRVLFTGRWCALHLAALALIVAMILLGRWQLDVSNSKHFDLQNFFYAFQWWIFAGFVVFFWVRVARDARQLPDAPETGGRVAVRSDAAPALVVGPAVLVGTDRLGGPPVVYRGYVMPQSATSPDRRGDDRMRAPYNDYLWQLALADAAKGEGPMPTAARPTVDLRAVYGADGSGAPGTIGGPVISHGPETPVIDGGPVIDATPTDDAP